MPFSRVSLSLILLFCTLGTSCTFEYFSQNKEVITEGHSRLYSVPYWTSDYHSPKRYRRIVIVATNDVLGQVEPHQEQAKYTQGRAHLSYQVGGAAVLARYFDILRKKYPGQTLFLDAGNRYQGTLFSNYDQGEFMTRLYGELAYDALTVGNHDFEFGPQNPHKTMASLEGDAQGQLKKNISRHRAPTLAANLIDLQTSQLIQWPNSAPYTIKLINDLKVAVIGGLSSFAWQATRKENLRGLYISKLSTAIAKYAHQAREKHGAQIVIALIHAGGHCGQTLMKRHRVNQYQVNFNPYNEEICDPQGEVFQVIQAMAKGTVDAVVAGHTRTKIANFYRGTPVIQSFSKGQFFGRMELVYDLQKRRVDQTKTRIHQPTKLCHQFFQSTQDCYSGNPAIKLSKLTPATFLGELIYPDPAFTRLISHHGKQIAKKSQRKILRLGQVAKRELARPTVMKNLISYSIQQATRAQIGLTSNTEISPWGKKKGYITFKDIYEAFPRESHLSKISLTGSELTRLVEIATASTGAWAGQFSGIQVVLHSGVLEERDLNGDGKQEPWEQNRLKSLKLSDGSKIEEDFLYTLGTQTFLSEESAAHYDFIFSSIPKERKETLYNATNRQALLSLFQSLARNQTLLKKIIDQGKDWLITI